MASARSNSETSPADDPRSEIGLEELMRIMDVATVLRREQERVDREFDLDATKQQLHGKLIRAAEMTGETLTEEQVAAAVSWYFDNLHEYQEPAKGLAWYFAHLYVRRIRILQWTIPLGLFLMITWAIWLAPFAPFSRQHINQRQIDSAFNQIEQTIKSIRSVSRSQEADTTIAQLEVESKLHYANLDSDRLAELIPRLQKIESRLNETFTITIAGGENQRSGFERNFEDEKGKRISGHYLIVQARSPNGKPLKRNIRNVETDSMHVVTQWAERVPKSVYDRLVQDKTEDGILDETIFGTKNRGELDVEMVIPNEDNVPIQRTAQITKW